MKSEDPIIPFLILYLTQPKSNFYLSKLISGSTNPKLEPFKAADLDLGNQTILGETMNIALKDMVVRGLSNIQVPMSKGKPELTVHGNNVNFTAKMPNTEVLPPNIPKVVIVSTRLKITPHNTPAFGGGLTVKVKTAHLLGSFKVTSIDGTPQNVEISFSKLQIEALALLSNIDIDLKVNSLFDAFIKSVLSQKAILNKILSAINTQINRSTVLNSISEHATIAARKSLEKISIK